MEKDILTGETKSLNDQFVRTFLPYLASMRRRCRVLAGSVWDGDDLFQNVLMKLFQAWKKDRSRKVTKTYLFRIISNAWIDHHRKVRVPEIDKESFEDMAACDQTIEYPERLVMAMKIVLHTLNSRQRLVYLMQAGWGLSSSEIAKLCGESDGNVRVLYHRARKKMRPELTDPGQQIDDQRLDRYISAFQSGDPERLLALYREESAACLVQEQHRAKDREVRCLLAA
ncbi:sigma-70 family RNA polymerase sigma factor [Sporolactobacillus kofuensis]|uniref:Sigma-70 family RNA polymerase sigma factor n=2 Tax=Sporolactobacillus kofuensis TaxID=269672 RepID=A0ABW1WKW0_9BACL